MPDTPPYTSVVANLFATGLHQVIFKTISGPKLMNVTAPDFADSVALDAMVAKTKTAGSLGTMVNERMSMDLLRDVCRHGSNPFKLENFATYNPSAFDLAVCVHGSIDGERPVWDQLIVPNFQRLGISTDPGIVPRNAPEGLGVQDPVGGGQADPAMKALTQALDALRSLSHYSIAVAAGPPAVPQVIPITETTEWKTNVAPLLAGPFMSGR